MTREQWQERLPVIQAFCEGKKIQFKNREESKWLDDEICTHPGLGLAADHLEWRIKPQPRRVWCQKLRDGTLGCVQKFPPAIGAEDNYVEFVEVVK